MAAVMVRCRMRVRAMLSLAFPHRHSGTRVVSPLEVSNVGVEMLTSVHGCGEWGRILEASSTATRRYWPVGFNQVQVAVSRTDARRCRLKLHPSEA